MYVCVCVHVGGCGTNMIGCALLLPDTSLPHPRTGSPAPISYQCAFTWELRGGGGQGRALDRFCRPLLPLCLLFTIREQEKHMLVSYKCVQIPISNLGIIVIIMHLS